MTIFDYTNLPTISIPYILREEGNVAVRQLDWAAGPGGGDDDDDEVPVTDSGKILLLTRSRNSSRFI